MKRICYLSNHSPDPNGGGGYHRTYQIFFDLESVAGKGSVETPAIFGKIPRKGYKIRGILEALNLRLILSSKIWRLGFNPNHIINHLLLKNKTGFNIFRRISIEAYQKFIRDNGKPGICVVDSAKFSPVIRLNRSLNIPTIFCPHNLDAFDLSAHLLNDEESRARCGISLIYELDSILESDHALMISKIEETLLDGLGVPSNYYPYLPVGEIRHRLMAIRQARTQNKVDPNLFFLFGSINHTTTFESFKWFLTCVRSHKLPPNIRIDVAGRGCETLEAVFSDLPGVRFLGQLEQDELNKELERVRAILIPQLSGFGAVTRISEMACAGIPMIVSKHTTNALDIPPGILLAENDWNDWDQSLRKILLSPTLSPSSSEYEKWESQQPNPIIHIVESLLTQSI